jgi:anaerobic selenocysteine-containing dehydrogenase
MDAVGYRIAQSLRRNQHACEVQPVDDRRHRQGPDGRPDGRLIGATGRLDYDNAGFAMFIGSNPVVSHGHTVGCRTPRRDPRPREACRGLDRRPSLYRDGAARDASPRAAAGTDYAVLAYLVRELLRDGVKAPAQDVDALAAAVAPFTLQHASTIADVPEAELERLLSAVRRAGRIVVDTGTGVTMSASANVTQWLSWALLIITESMNRPGGIWFHPGFAYQLESFELPISPPEGQFGPGPRSRPRRRRSCGSGRAPRCPTRSTRATSAPS